MIGSPVEATRLLGSHKTKNTTIADNENATAIHRSNEVVDSNNSVTVAFQSTLTASDRYPQCVLVLLSTADAYGIFEARSLVDVNDA